MELRTLDVCLVWDTRGDNGVFYWFTWCMFWHSTRGFPRWHWGNLCIGVDAHFHPCFSDRNLGALFEVPYVGLNIMNLKLFDAYCIIDPRILVVTLEYLGEIRVDWCVSYGVILLRTLGLFVTLIGIAQWIDWKEWLWGGFVPYKQFHPMFSAIGTLEWLLSHVEGLPYDLIML